MERPRFYATPSKAAMWLVCANSLAANADQQRTDSEAANLGTDKHELMTTCLSSGTESSSYIGLKLKKGNTVDKDFTEDVRFVVDAVRDRIQNYELQGASTELILDTRVPISHITGEYGATGVLDIGICAHWPDGSSWLDVIDAKFGHSEVEAKDNPQLMMYASGFLSFTKGNYKEVRLLIAQPSHGISEWNPSVEYIHTWADTVAWPAAQNALGVLKHGITNFRAYGVSKKSCQWCGAKAVCPALNKYVEATISVDLGIVSAEDAELIDPEELAYKFPSLYLVEQWIDAVRDRVMAELLSGKSLPGLKLVTGKKGNRAWASEEEAELMMKKFKLKQEQMYSQKLLGPKPILDMLKDQPRRLKQIESLVVQPSGKPQVALESDKRPALEIEPMEQGFDTIDDLY